MKSTKTVWIKAGLAAVFLGTLAMGVAIGATQDGEYLMAMVSSPQSLVMGTGDGKLTEGSAVVKLPDSFCRCMEAQGMKVFVSSAEDVGGLTVKPGEGNSFVVTSGRKSDAAFSWLVVAPPKSVPNAHDHR